jgi:hypothetical protein
LAVLQNAGLLLMARQTSAAGRVRLSLVGRNELRLANN